MQPLAPSDSSSTRNTRTNLSTSISMTLFDQYGQEISFLTNVTDPIELIIERDTNLVVTTFELQNVTSLMLTNRTFHLHYVNLSREDDLSISAHLEIYPINQTLAYWLIYRYDTAPQIDGGSVQVIDGWNLLCPTSKTIIFLHTSNEFFFLNRFNY